MPTATARQHHEETSFVISVYCFCFFVLIVFVCCFLCLLDRGQSELLPYNKENIRCTGIDERRLNTVKKHFGKFGIALVAALLMLLTCALCASAADKATVVYLSGSGDKGGNGLTPETATSSINTAYSLLDPKKDCTVVVCGPFTQKDHFARPETKSQGLFHQIHKQVTFC